MPIKKDGRRTPKEVIESVQNPHLEEAWYKFPREELVSESEKRYKDGVDRQFLKPDSPRQKRHMAIHTHPYVSEGSWGANPSYIDLHSFLQTKQEKFLTIAQTDPENGRLIGCCFIRKTKLTPNLENTYDNVRANIEMRQDAEAIKFTTNRAVEYIKNEEDRVKIMNLVNRQQIKKFCNKYHLQYKYVPAKKDEQEVQRHVHSGLEKQAIAASILLMTASLIISGIQITGNVAGDGIINNYSIWWLVLFMLGLLGVIVAKIKSK